MKRLLCRNRQPNGRPEARTPRRRAIPICVQRCREKGRHRLGAPRHDDRANRKRLPVAIWQKWFKPRRSRDDTPPLPRVGRSQTPAPLKLVAAQRIEHPPAAQRPPVRPSRGRSRASPRAQFHQAGWVRDLPKRWVRPQTCPTCLEPQRPIWPLSKDGRILAPAS